jgi:hypothetical protein
MALGIQEVVATTAQKAVVGVPLPFSWVMANSFRMNIGGLLITSRITGKGLDTSNRYFGPGRGLTTRFGRAGYAVPHALSK